MKQIICYIRPDKYNDTKQELLQEGILGLNSQMVQGRGKKSVTYAIEDEGEEVEGYQDYPLMPKKQVTIVVEDEDVDKAIAAILRANKTGNSGDGKVFILPVMDTIKIRTNEHVV